MAGRRGGPAAARARVAAPGTLPGDARPPGSGPTAASSRAADAQAAEPRAQQRRASGWARQSVGGAPGGGLGDPGDDADARGGMGRRLDALPARPGEGGRRPSRPAWEAARPNRRCTAARARRDRADLLVVGTLLATAQRRLVDASAVRSAPLTGMQLVQHRKGCGEVSASRCRAAGAGAHDRPVGRRGGGGWPAASGGERGRPGAGLVSGGLLEGCQGHHIHLGLGRACNVLPVASGRLRAEVRRRRGPRLSHDHEPDDHCRGRTPPTPLAAARRPPAARDCCVSRQSRPAWPPAATRGCDPAQRDAYRTRRPRPPAMTTFWGLRAAASSRRRGQEDGLSRLEHLQGVQAAASTGRFSVRAPQATLPARPGREPRRRRENPSGEALQSPEARFSHRSAAVDDLMSAARSRGRVQLSRLLLERGLPAPPARRARGKRSRPRASRTSHARCRERRATSCGSAVARSAGPPVPVSRASRPVRADAHRGRLAACGPRQREPGRVLWIRAVGCYGWSHTPGRSPRGRRPTALA